MSHASLTANSLVGLKSSILSRFLFVDTRFLFAVYVRDSLVVWLLPVYVCASFTLIKLDVAPTSALALHRTTAQPLQQLLLFTTARRAQLSA